MESNILSKEENSKNISVYAIIYFIVFLLYFLGSVFFYYNILLTFAFFSGFLIYFGIFIVAAIYYGKAQGKKDWMLVILSILFIIGGWYFKSKGVLDIDFLT